MHVCVCVLGSGKVGQAHPSSVNRHAGWRQEVLLHQVPYRPAHCWRCVSLSVQGRATDFWSRPLQVAGDPGTWGTVSGE